MNIRGVTYLPVVISLLLFGGCAGYAGEVKEMRSALHAQNKAAALESVNDALDVSDGDAYPVEVDGETALLLLERGTIKQSMTRFKQSAIDYRLADNNIEMLDVQRDPLGKIGEWIFSGDAANYRAPVYEKLLLNTFNMLNYLAMGDLESARVEARRIDVTQQSVMDEEDDADAILGFADYLSGFTFEMSGRYEQALQQYAASLAGGQHFTLKEVTDTIGRCTAYKSDKLAAAFSEQSTTASGESPETSDQTGCTLMGRDTGTILVVSSVGLAPRKEATRLPIGAAVVIGAAYLSPTQTSQANSAVAKGLLKWVNFTELRKSTAAYTTPTVTIDGTPVSLAYTESISDLVERAFERMKGKMIAAAIVRMVTRAIAGEAVGQGVKAGSDNAALGLLAQILVEGSMTAADTPDTRCWNTLPASVAITRMEVPAGTHEISVRFNGSGKPINKTIKRDVAPGGFIVIPVHTLK